MESKNSYHHESWESFGQNVIKFVENKRSQLSTDSFDVILGFTRGGHVLATVLSCYLRDLIDEYANSTHKGAVRPIPGKISIKRYDNACFVMQEAASREEVLDLAELKKDLFGFCQEHELKKINVLLVDDNLTGSSRMDWMIEQISRLDFITLKTLAYTRHPSFITPSLSYIIRDYPKGTSFFVMPYHKVNNKVTLKNVDVSEMVTFSLRYKDKINLEILKNDIECLRDFTKAGLVDRGEYKHITIKRGESAMNFAIGVNEIIFMYLPQKWYPPKKCLKGEHPIFKTSLCKYCGVTLDANYCTLCSYLHCNFDIIQLLVQWEDGDRVMGVYGRNPSTPKDLIHVAEEWLKDNFGSKIVINA